MWSLFQRKPKSFSGARVTERAIELVQDNLVLESIRKDAIQFIRVGRDRQSRKVGNVVIYLHASKNRCLRVTSTKKGYREVERYMLGLPRVNANSVIVMMESTSDEDFEVWRRT